MPSVFFAFRDAPERRAALSRPGSLDRYRLFGMDEFVERGAQVRHNLERPVPVWAHALGRLLNATANATGGLGGDFASLLPFRHELNAADVVFGTVDTVGIPLLHLRRTRLVRPPLVYASIGLPERLARLRNEHGFRRALTTAQTLVAYSIVESDRLRDWIGGKSPRVVFVPFGVDVDAFRPPEREPELDVVSVGADPRRDFELLLAIAERRPEVRFHIVATAERARELRALPNVTIEADVPLETVRERLGAARVVALPVRDNTYSGATTTLLQAMAMARPAVVSRTDAIADGYALEDGANCLLVPPGDVDAFERALVDVLSDAAAAAHIGAAARETVVQHFSWEQYIDKLWRIMFDA